MTVGKRIAWTIAGVFDILFVPVLLHVKVTTSYDYTVIEPDSVFLWPVLVVLVVAIVSVWLPTRFSIRTLFVAMAVVSILLGVLVWLSKQ
jgi:hypothetical protein